MGMGYIESNGKVVDAITGQSIEYVDHIEKIAPYGVDMEAVYILKKDKRYRVGVVGIMMRFGIPYVGLTSNRVISLKKFLKLFRKESK